MAHRFGLKFNHVPYRSSPQSIVDIASGHVHFAFAEAGASQALIRDGKLRALAVSSHQRLPAHPAIPPFAEVAQSARLRDRRLAHAGGALGTPKPILERLNGDMKRIMAAPEMQQRMSNMGLIPLDPAPLGDRALHQVRNRQMADAADHHRPRWHAIAMTVDPGRERCSTVRMTARIAVAAAALWLSLAAQAQQFGPAQFAIKDDDGDPITNSA